MDDRQVIKDEEPTGAEQVPDTPRERRLEFVVTILLGAAALLGAWGAYESGKYSGRENASHASAARLQVRAAQADDRAGRQSLIDVSAFYEWVDAIADGDQARADVLRERFRDEVVTAFELWLTLDPFDNPDAAATPFELPEYRLAAAEDGAALHEAAEIEAVRAEKQGDLSDQYLLTVVLLAAALFQLGIQSRIGVFELRVALVAVSGAIVVGTAIWLLTLPKLWPG